MAVANGHRAIVVDDAARIDELVICTDEREQLPAMSLEDIKRCERIRCIGNVA